MPEGQLYPGGSTRHEAHPVELVAPAGGRSGRVTVSEPRADRKKNQRNLRDKHGHVLGARSLHPPGQEPITSTITYPGEPVRRGFAPPYLCGALPAEP